MTWFGGKDAGERAKRAIHSKRRRLREQSATPEDEEIDRKAIWEIHGKCCHICKLPVPFDRMHLDHIVALANGGTNTTANLAPAHESCNTSKGARSGEKRKGLRSKGFRRKKVPPKLPDDGEMF